MFHCCCGTCASILHHRGTLRTETPHRQQGHVAHTRHWTVDLSQSPSSRPAPRRHLFLPPSAVTQNIIFINFSYAQLRTLSAFLSLLGHVLRCLHSSSVPQPFSSHCPLSSSFLFCLTAVVGLCIALIFFRFLFSFFFFFLFFFFEGGIQYIYISDVRNKRNLYIK